MLAFDSSKQCKSDVQVAVLIPYIVLFICRMDPNSTYLLEIRLFGNKKRVRKDFRCFCFDMTIDSDLTNYKDLLEEIVEKWITKSFLVLEHQHARRLHPRKRQIRANLVLEHQKGNTQFMI